MLKRVAFLFTSFFLLFLAACKYDDSILTDRVNNLDQRLTLLEEQCRQINTNVNSLQILIEALQEKDYITSVLPLRSGNDIIGYTISFTKSPSITIYHGKDGSDGKDGNDGTDGYTPVIGVQKDSDGHYYWTLDGEWLTDIYGGKIPAEGQPGNDGKDGQDGVDGQNGMTPEFKIEDGNWFISLDGGFSWTYLGRAIGQDGSNGADGRDGEDGDSIFDTIDTSDPDFVIFTLIDGTTIKIPTWYAFEELKKMCERINVNIQSLQTIVDAVNARDYITACNPIIEDGTQIGFSISFAKGGNICVYNGHDGQDGNHGENGSDGKDGHTPLISAKRDGDNVLYWTVDGEWLLDEDNCKIPVGGRDGNSGSDGKDGKDGITPQLKIESGNWFVSTDNGITWQNLGQATGETGKDGQNGADGDSMFSNVDTSIPGYVTFVLSDGTEFSLPRSSELSITFGSDALIAIRPNTTRHIKYSIEGNTTDLHVEVLSSGNVRAKIDDNTATEGNLIITTGSTIDDYDKIVILVANDNRTIMRSLTFEEGELTILGNSTFEISAEGGPISINIETNTQYSVAIPSYAENWISISESRAIRTETINLFVAPNEAKARTATVDLIDIDGTVYSISITQNANNLIPENMEIAFPDPVFRAFVLDNYDLNNDGKISDDEARQVTEMRYSNNTPLAPDSKKISSLKGIEYFTEISLLEITFNNIQTLDVSNLHKLETLLCYFNKVRNLNVSNLVHLKELQCQCNELEELIITNTPELASLTCDSNNLTTLDVSDHSNLLSLSCRSNNLVNLNLTNSPNITYFECWDNQLSQLDLSSQTQLVYLSCYNNRITELDLTNCSKLYQLNCSNNLLESLDTSANHKLIDIDCSYNNLRNLEYSHNSGLQALNCQNNYLSDLEIHLSNIHSIICDNNCISNLELIYSCPNLEMLHCSNNQLSNWLNILSCPHLKSLHCSNNQLSGVNVQGCAELIDLDCSYNNIYYELSLSETNLGNSTEDYPLNCSHNPELELLTLKYGWEINGINIHRNSDFIPENTRIEYIE